MFLIVLENYNLLDAFIVMYYECLWMSNGPKSEVTRLEGRGTKTTLYVGYDWPKAQHFLQSIPNWAWNPTQKKKSLFINLLFFVSYINIHFECVII